MRQQLVCGQIGRLTTVEDGFGDVRGEIAEADEPREIGRAHPLPLGQCGKRHAIAVEECGIEPARLDQQLDESCIGFAVANGSVPSINILIARPERRNRTAMDKI
jgi:hypothetical protein